MAASTARVLHGEESRPVDPRPQSLLPPRIEHHTGLFRV